MTAATLNTLQLPRTGSTTPAQSGKSFWTLLSQVLEMAHAAGSNGRVSPASVQKVRALAAQL